MQLNEQLHELSCSVHEPHTVPKNGPQRLNIMVCCSFKGTDFSRLIPNLTSIFPKPILPAVQGALLANQ